jgi:hypothetical protein
MNETIIGFGKLLVIVGVIFIVAGMVLIYFQKIPFSGKLPGDIFIKRGNFSFYFPIATSILLSIVLSLIFYLISKFKQ